MLLRILKGGYRLTKTIALLKLPTTKATAYSKIVVLGNSITRHPPLAEIHWAHDWGMAATSQNKDFVHLLQERFRKRLPHAQLLVENIATWENTYWEYDLAQLAFVRAFEPELLIIRVGENVAGATVEEHNFATHFSRLLDYLHSPTTRVIVAGSFWDGNPATAIMHWVCKAHKVSFLSLAKLGNEMGNRAIGQHQNSGVANHPNDKGMLAIADAIWAII
jgi:hypothetical protein